jgi:hypothetical protein
LNESRIIVEQAQSAIAAIAEQPAFDAGLVTVIDGEAHYSSFPDSRFGFATNGAPAFLLHVHLFIFAWRQAINALKSSGAFVTLMAVLQFGRLGDLLRAFFCASTIAFATTFSAVTVSVTSSDCIGMALLAGCSFRLRMRFVVLFEALAATSIQFVAVVSTILSLKFRQAAFAMTVGSFADFSEEMFTAPTSRRIGAIASAIFCSHGHIIAGCGVMSMEMVNG